MHITESPSWRRRVGTGGLTAVALAAVTALGVSAAAAPVADAQRLPGQTDCAVDYDIPQWFGKYGQYQQLLARTPDGQMPDGVASEPDFSRDSRANKRVVFTSTATNIAGPVQPGAKNIYVVQRTGDIGALGNAWQVGRTVLISKGTNGPANGDSYAGSMSGFTGAADAPKGPAKLAFLSKATNLPGGNPSGVSAYVANTDGGGIKRLKAPGTATGVGISGDSKVLYVSTTSGLYVLADGKKAKRLVKGGGIDSPSTTLNGNQAAFAQRGVVYTVTIKGKKRRIAAGTHPHADGGEPGKKSEGKQGNVRAITFNRGTTAWKAQLIPKFEVKQFGPKANGTTAVNGGGAAIAFGNGAGACVKVEVIVGPKTGQTGGYDIPQGGCPEGQGTVADVSLSTRYNYVAFTCTGGGLYHYWIGDKGNDRHPVS